jgi:CheY-like chemotaxis protein
MNPSPPARLLIVDDERAQVEALCRTLTSEGYLTTGAHSGPEALAALRGAAKDRSAAPMQLVRSLATIAIDKLLDCPKRSVMLLLFMFQQFKRPTELGVQSVCVVPHHR